MAIGVTKPATPAAVADVSAGGKARGGDGVFASSDAPDGDTRIPVGTMISDRYRIARVLGEGGMGVVYAAEHVLMRKEVAVKVLHAEMCGLPEVVARFEREAIAAAHIDHPNVAGATDFGRLPDGACFLVLELLRGTSLRDEIAKGPIALGRALRILRGIVSGVAAAHAKGIVHRDLKPENVMLVGRDRELDFVKVLDFGIAKVDPSFAAANQGGGKALTRVGAVFGTPEYMAPEQAIGDIVDARADLYALGVVFLEMLTGKCPFTGNALSILRERILAEGPPDMSAVPEPAARALVGRLLTRQPDDRMQSANELLVAIDGLLDERLEERKTGSMPPPSAIVLPVNDDVVATSATVFVSAGAERPRWLVPLVALAALIFVPTIVLVLSLIGRPTEAKDATSATSVASASAAPSVTASLPASATVESGEPGGEANVSDETPPAASAASARTHPRTKTAPHRRSAPPRKTGPGGIYVPPPKDWFK